MDWTNARNIRIEVFPGAPGLHAPEKVWWYWHLRWPNGRIAAVSEGYTRKATALRFARKMVDRLLVEVPVEQPVPPTAAPAKKTRGRSRRA